jgi:hypothetical protein
MAEMANAYKLAAAAVRQRFAEQHPDDLAGLDRIEAGDVAAYSGSFDQAEEVFRCLGVPVTVDPDPQGLKARIVFSNCSNSYPPGLVERARDHVEQGHWLVTSDWSLDHLLEPAFPNTVRWTRQGTLEEVVAVEPALGSLWSEVVVLGADPQWWLWGSHPIEVLDAEKVRVEAASHDLLVRYGAPVVAVTFPWGQGHVFHVISHFWAKKSGTPTLRHTGPGVDFLRAGMRLSEEGIGKVLRDTGLAADAVNFAMLQSAATATELVAQLCVRAKRDTPRRGGER